MMKKQLGAVLAVGSLAALAGCGGSSNSSLSYSAFSNAADKICANVNSQAQAIGSAGGTANADAAAKLNKVVALSNTALSQMKALSGPSALNSARDTFVSDVMQQTTTAQSAASAATSGDQSAYIAALTQLASQAGQTNTDGSKLGAPSCAKG